MRLASKKKQRKKMNNPSRHLENPKGEMPFLDHLEELRKRLLRISIAVIVTSIISFVWAGELFELLTGPLRESFKGASLIGTGPAEAFLVKLKVSLVAGIIISSPISFYQIWQFIAPGLYSNEKQHAGPFVVVSTLFFITGISFCYILIFPFAFQFFSEEFASIGINPTIKIGEYLAFAVKLLLIFGLVFELPVLSYFLARLGLITHTFLIDKARYAILIVFILAAILTPPDVVTQLLLAAPLIVLYGLCIIIVKLVAPKKDK